MAKPSDVISDALERLRPYLSRDERARLEIELRAEHGGKHFYVRVAPGQRAARKRAAGVRGPGLGK